MQGIPSRLKKHVEVCINVENSDIDDDVQIVSSSPALTEKRKSNEGENPSSSKKPTSKQRYLKKYVDSDIIMTSPDYALKITKQIGRFFYATNTPFSHASHQEFTKLCEIMRPGFKPPSRHQLSGKILDSTHADLMDDCKSKLRGQTVTMCMDGWSNVHNDPIICCSVNTQYGESILVETIDTSGHHHNSEYLTELAETAITAGQSTYGFKVRSFVTDNTANVALMRKKLKDLANIDIIEHGCSAHLLNLLAKDLQLPNIEKFVLDNIKYFRNTHLPRAWFKEAGGSKLILPIEVRWNTISDAVRSFLVNRGKLVQICQDHKDEIDKNIFRLVNDVNLANNASDYSEVMTPISVALDRMQRDNTTISVAVEIWHKLQMDLDLENPSRKVKDCFLSRRNQALKATHYLANMIDHRFLGFHLDEAQRAAAYKYISEKNESFTAILMAHLNKSRPFAEYLYGDGFREILPLTWWQSCSLEADSFGDMLNWSENKDSWFDLSEQLLTASASTAGLERLFSSFGFVQSKIRNRLGNEKSARLTFMFKYLNKNPQTEKRTNLKWVWEIDSQIEAQIESSEEEIETNEN